MARARTFYEAVFDVQLTKLDGTELEMWAFPMAQERFGPSGALIHIPGFSSGDNSVVIYFHCEDCAVEAERAAQSVGRIKTAKSPSDSMVISF